MGNCVNNTDKAFYKCNCFLTLRKKEEETARVRDLIGGI